MNLVRVGADFDAIMNDSEITRIDFDTDEGTMSLCVQHLASVGKIIVDLYAQDDPVIRQRVAQFNAKRRGNA